jgi:hypothetical protein
MIIEKSGDGHDATKNAEAGAAPWWATIRL